jgi:hypothetical protein
LLVRVDPKHRLIRGGHRDLAAQNAPIEIFHGILRAGDAVHGYSVDGVEQFFLAATAQNLRKPLSTIMCLKVSRLFGSSAEVWMRLQAAYDLMKAQQNKKVMARVPRIVPVKVA